MEDRLKFRVFYKPTKKMFYLDQIWNNDWYDTSKGRNTGTLSNNNKTFSPLVYDKQIELMQCLGLKDSNGDLIYEGDIIKITEDEPNCIVKYCDKCSALTLFYPYGSEFISTHSGEDEVPCDIEYCCQICDNNFSMQDQFHEVKIIGNIHQNPELLERE